MKHGLNMEVLGVNRTPISKIKNNYRWRIIIKCTSCDTIVKMLTIVTDKFMNSKAKDVTLGVDVNPMRI